MKGQHIFALVVLSAVPLLGQQNDWLIVPGKPLGPIIANTTRLDRFFGKVNVHDQPVDTGNGPEPATVIFFSKPEQALSLSWIGNKIGDILVCYPETTSHSKWHTEGGITLGSSIEKLEALNGRPFQCYPWVSDLGGNIIS